MREPNADGDVDGATPTQQAQRPLRQAPLDDVAFEQWRCELDSFVTATRRRLETLSRSLSSRHARTCSPVSEEVQQELHVDATVRQSPATKTLPLESTVPDVDRQEGDADPLQSLNAIKRRLAQQIENA